LLFGRQCAPFAILKPKNRKTAKKPKANSEQSLSGKLRSALVSFLFPHSFTLALSCSAAHTRAARLAFPALVHIEKNPYHAPFPHTCSPLPYLLLHVHVGFHLLHHNIHIPRIVLCPLLHAHASIARVITHSIETLPRDMRGRLEGGHHVYGRRVWEGVCD
jgi:hypothetical protein